MLEGFSFSLVGKPLFNLNRYETKIKFYFGGNEIQFITSFMQSNIENIQSMAQGMKDVFDQAIKEAEKILLNQMGINKDSIENSQVERYGNVATYGKDRFHVVSYIK